MNKHFRARLEQLVSKVIKGNKGFQVLKVCLALRVIKVIQDLKVHVVQKEIGGKWECQDFLVLMVFMDCQDHQV